MGFHVPTLWWANANNWHLFPRVHLYGVLHDNNDKTSIIQYSVYVYNKI